MHMMQRWCANDMQMSTSCQFNVIKAGHTQLSMLRLDEKWNMFAPPNSNMNNQNDVLEMDGKGDSSKYGHVWCLR